VCREPRLAQHPLDTCGQQVGDEPVVGVQCIGEQHVPGMERAKQRARESQLAVPGPAKGAAGGREHRTAGQTVHGAQTRQRETHAFGLAGRLREGRLVARRVRHRHAGPIEKLDVSIAPAPAAGSPFAEQSSALAAQRLQHRKRQPAAGAAVATGAHALGREALGGAAGRPAVHRTLTGSVGREHLAQEHRERHRRWIQPLAVLGQVRLGDLQQLGTGQGVEQIHRRAAACSAVKARALLPSREGVFTMTHGWPRMLVGRLCGNIHLNNSEPAFSFNFNCLAQHCAWRFGLSKRH